MTSNRSTIAAMEVVTAAVAVLGVLLGALSLGWQIASHMLTGGRAKAELLMGALGRGGMATGSVKSVDEAAMKDLAEEGFTQPVIVVRVRNVGRLPVTVTGWSIATGRGVAYKPLGDSIGPPLSHRLEAGETEDWAVDATRIRAMVHTTVEVFKIPIGRVKVGGNVSLGDGRTV